MAVRSGAGTGVVVALVVFVLTTVFLLVMSIVFYRGQTIARESDATAQEALSQYIKPAQASQDVFAGYKAMATQNGQSVVEYLHNNFRGLMETADGSPSTSFDQFQAKARRLGTDDAASLLQVATQLDNNLKRTQTEVQSKDRRIAERDNEITDLQTEIERMRKTQEESSAKVETQLDEYGALVADYNQKLGEVMTQMESSVARLGDRYRGEINDLEDEKDDLLTQMSGMRSRLSELQELFEDIRRRGKNPALLVDGLVIDTVGSDQIFIDRGRRDRIVRGMTFEVYHDEMAIVDPVNSDIQPGKASLHVVKVGETTSTCKLTRSTPGRPVVRGDVIANAVYDPNYQFSFLIHGKFDIDGDGRPTEAEAEYLRSLSTDWGGRVVNGTQLPGDLDFLVLGNQPVEPAPLANNAPEHVVADYVRMRQAHETYLGLFGQAKASQIPVLNGNRFLILIGHTN